MFRRAAGGALGADKRMDPGCTNPFIDELFEVMTPYINGGKLAGAGGGGFVMAMARDPEAVAALSAALAARYPGTPVAVWPCAVPDEGLRIKWNVGTLETSHTFNVQTTNLSENHEESIGLRRWRVHRRPSGEAAQGGGLLGTRCG